VLTAEQKEAEDVDLNERVNQLDGRYRAWPFKERDDG
jgi:hypothetical protein